MTILFDKGPVLEQGSPFLLHVSKFKLKLKPDIPVSFFFLSRVFDLIVQFENNFKVMNSTRGILERLDAGEVILSRLKSKYKKVELVKQLGDPWGRQLRQHLGEERLRQGVREMQGRRIVFVVDRQNLMFF